MTDDLDLFVDDSAAKVERLKATLLEFGFTTAEVKDYRFRRPNQILRFGHPPKRTAIMRRISGVRFATACANRIRTKIDGMPVEMISLRDLLRNKRAAGRLKDLADAEELLRVKGIQRRRRGLRA